MITVEQLEGMSERLRVYDVDQNGWPHERLGFVENVTHMFTHLGKAVTGKNFNDPETIKQDLAPDELHYAMRLGRCTQQTGTLLLPSPIQDEVLNDLSERNFKRALPLHQVAFLDAVTTISCNLEPAGHPDRREKARDDRKAMARTAAGLLIRAAELQAEQYEFDLEQVFDDKLRTLRIQFGKPEPAQSDMIEQG